MRDRVDSAAVPAASCRSCLREDFTASPRRANGWARLSCSCTHHERRLLGHTVTQLGDELAGASFNHLIGSGKQRRRDVEAEGLGRNQVDDEIEFGRLFDRDFAGLRPTQNLVDIACGTTE